MGRTDQRRRIEDSLARVELAESDLDRLEDSLRNDRQAVKDQITELRAHIEKELQGIHEQLDDVRRAQARGIIGQVAVAVTFASATAGLVINLVGG